MKNTSYKLNADGTIRTLNTKETSFKERLAKKYPTPNADKIIKNNPDIEKFDTHKFLK